MLRGFRWQFLAFVLAVSLFVISLSTRSSPETADQTSTHTPPGVVTQPAATSAPVPDSSAVSPLPVPLPGGTQIPTYREALVGSVQRLNPLLAALNPVDRDITSLIFEGLTRTNQYGEPEPALASGWVVSYDRLEYVISLREDVLWQDGIPFSADDVMFTMSLLSSPDFTGPADLAAFWRTVETERLGDFMVRFRLAQPLGSFLDALQIGILPAHALAGTPASQLASHPFNLTPIGTGPYQLEALRGDSGRVRTVDLRAAPVFRQRPEGQNGFSIERITFRLYDDFESALQAIRAGEVDGLAGRSRLDRQPLLNLGGSFNTFTTFEPTLGALIFNWANDAVPHFRDVRVRQALQLGLDRAAMIERHLANTAVQADSPLVPGTWAYSANLLWPAYDLAAARDLLARANIQPVASEDETAEESSSVLFRFVLLTPDDPALVNLAREVAIQWSQLNVEAQVAPVDLASYRRRLESGDFDAALVELSKSGSADPDVYSFWHQGQYPNGQNFGGANDRTISELLERGRRDHDGINRMVYYQEFQRQFIQRAIAIPLYYPLYTYAVRASIDGVQLGLISSPQERFRTLRDWVIRSG